MKELYSIFWKNARMILNYTAHMCNLKNKNGAAEISSAAAISSIQRMIIRRISQILSNIPVEQQIHIIYRSVIDQSIQFAGFVHIPDDLVFDSGAVDGDHAAVCIFDLDTGCVDIEFIRDLSFHVVLPKAKIIRTLLATR